MLGGGGGGPAELGSLGEELGSLEGAEDGPDEGKDGEELAGEEGQPPTGSAF